MIRLITENTIEVNILDTAQQKLALDRQMKGGSGPSRTVLEDYDAISESVSTSAKTATKLSAEEEPEDVDLKILTHLFS